MTFPIVSFLFLTIALTASIKRAKDGFPPIPNLEKSSAWTRFWLLISGMFGVDRYSDKSISKDQNTIYAYATLILMITFTALVFIEIQLGWAKTIYVLVLVFFLNISSGVLSWGCTNTDAIDLTHRCCGDMMLWPIIGVAMGLCYKICSTQTNIPAIYIAMLSLSLGSYDYMRSPNKSAACQALTNYMFLFLFGVMTGAFISCPVKWALIITKPSVKKFKSPKSRRIKPQR